MCAVKTVDVVNDGDASEITRDCRAAVTEGEFSGNRVNRVMVRWTAMVS